MVIGEDEIDRWLERGGKFFKTVARNPVVRAALHARGLSDDELHAGWKLYPSSTASAAKPQPARRQRRRPRHKR